MIDDDDDDDGLLTPQEKYGWREGEREAAEAELRERTAKNQRDEVMAWAKQRVEAKNADTISRAPDVVVTKSYNPPIPDTNDAIARAQQAIEALRRSKPKSDYGSRRRAGELIRAQQELNAAAHRVTEAVARPRDAVPHRKSREPNWAKVIGELLAEQEIAHKAAIAEAVEPLAARIAELEMQQEWRAKTRAA